jgi:hypothetical protein
MQSRIKMMMIRIRTKRLDPNTHRSERSDRHPHGSENLDTYPHKFDADPQYRIKIFQ